MSDHETPSPTDKSPISEDEGREKVGYKRPPKSGRFKKGKSGNPAGRPKGAKGLLTVVGETLAERVLVNENGRRYTISKLEATIKQLVNAAAAGSPKHTQQVLALVKWLEGNDAALASAPAALTDADREVLNFVYGRLKKADDDAP